MTQYDYDLVIIGQRPAARSALQTALQTVMRSGLPTELPKRARVAVVINPARAATPIAPIALNSALHPPLNSPLSQSVDPTFEPTFDPKLGQTGATHTTYTTSAVSAIDGLIAQRQRYAAAIAQACDQLNGWRQFQLAGADIIFGTGQWEIGAASPSRSRRSRHSAKAQSSAPNLPEIQYRVIPHATNLAESTTTSASLPQPLRPRVLRSRAFLLIPDARSVYPSSAVTATSPPTPSLFTPIIPVGHGWDLDAWWRSLQTIPPFATVYGSTLRAQELALSLHQLGTAVTWISPESSCLPWETPQTAQRWQAYLESVGIICHFNMAIHRVNATEFSKNFPPQPLFWAEPTAPDVPRTELEAIGVKFCGAHLQLDTQFRTTHPQIYACAAALPGEDHESITQVEAKMAVQNALKTGLFDCIFARNITPKYAQIPWSIGQAYVRVGGAWARERSAQLEPYQSRLQVIKSVKQWLNLRSFISKFLHRLYSIIRKTFLPIFKLNNGQLATSNYQSARPRSLVLQLHQLPSRQLLDQLDGYVEIKLTPDHKILEITAIAPDAAQLVTPLLLLMQLQNQYRDQPIQYFRAIEQLSLSQYTFDQSAAELCEWLRDTILAKN